MTLLELDQVGFRYPDGSIGLDACSLRIERGTRNALIGANGSGKTTLFQHTNGLFRPQTGTVRYAGEAVDYSRAGLRELRRRVGMVFQNPDRQLFSASVLEDVSFGPINLGLDEPTVRQRVADALRAVGMASCAGKAVHNLSFGQKKRACIAGVLAMAPEMLVLDEPMAGLDHGMKNELQTVLNGLHAEGITLLLATHDIDFAYRWADRIHLMNGGRCVASLSTDRLAECRAALSAVGLPLPAVIEMHHRLTTLGLLADHGELAAPRSLQELMVRLETAPPKTNCEGGNVPLTLSKQGIS